MAVATVLAETREELMQYQGSRENTGLGIRSLLDLLFQLVEEDFESGL